MAIAKIALTALGLTLLLSLLGIIASTDSATATPDEIKWSKIDIPTEGEAGSWVLADGSNLQHLTMAVDGTIYTYANPSATSYTLFRSTDGGYSWSSTGQVKDALVALAAAPDDARIIYYATAASIYQSVDGGNSFAPLPASPGGAGSNNITITSLAVTRLEGKSIVAVGTRDSDNSQYGGVYILDENKPFTGWVNSQIGNLDVSAIAFSPNFTTDRQLVAVATNETDTLVTTRIADTGWGKGISDAQIKGISAKAATIAFPDNYNATTGNYTLFAAIDTGSGNGDVYRINAVLSPASSVATDLNTGATYSLSNIDVTGLAVSGNATIARLLAGAANSTQVYISSDGGSKWVRSDKAPTGQFRTYLLMAPDFASSKLAYAATTGTESAFSRTTDGGVTWNQIGLIDTKISEIVDLAVSPDYRQGNSLFMLTWGGKHSLWWTGGGNWERVLTTTQANIDEMKRVELSPQYGNSSRVLFLAGTGGGNPAIWKSADNGQSFTRQSVPFAFNPPLDPWAVVNDGTLFLGSYDGSKGLVYTTNNSGFFYSTGAVAGNQTLKSIALSPNYERDRTILVGNTNGWVYWSEDNGTSFKPLPPRATSPPFSGEIVVAFDPGFSSNKVVYAASSAVDKGIYRFIISKSDAWESIDSTLPAGSLLSQLAVSANGTLYATNSLPVDAVKKKGGMERSLNPTHSLGPTFETVIRGLADNATLAGLWLRGNQVWSIDSKNTRLMTHTDSLALPVSPTTPANEAAGIGTKNVSLDWETLQGATKYHWQLNDEADFSTIPAGFEGDTQASSARLPALEPGTTYYWRVRATEPVLSPWSTKRSFTTILGTLSTTVIAPELYSPKAGADGVMLKPVFQWSALAGADRYELLVSTNVSLANAIIVKTGDDALPTTAWQSDISLDYATTYYWKVRASGSNSYSVWSAVGAFTTGSAPSQSSSAPESSSPSQPAPELPSVRLPPPLSPPSQSSPPSSLPPAQPTLPNWVIYAFGALLLTVVLLLIALLVLVVRRRLS
ncbi:MAG: hypothetical protein HY663_06175 [Chloroflexi bacterium]|nr:hypothetical protein [Chloroflexota bacterium]